MANSLIDFSVVRPEAAGSFLSGFQAAQERQSQLDQQQRQNALANLQLRAAQRGEEEALSEREAYKSQDPIKALYAGGFGAQAMALEKQRQEQRSAQLKQAADSHKFAKSIVAGIVANPTRENATKWLDWAESQGADMSQYRAELANTQDAGIGRWAFTHGEGADKALEQQVIDVGTGAVVLPKYAIGGGIPSLPQPTPAQPGMPVGIPGQTPPTRAAGTNALALPAPGGMSGAMPAGQPQAVPGGGMMYPKSMTPAQQAAEAREQTRIGLEQRRVELAEKEAARKEAGLAEPLSKKEIQSREAKYPQATRALNTFEANSDDLIKELEKLRDHPGLSGISGLIYGRTPGIMRESRQAQAIYKRIVSRGGFSELQEMRNASPTGGALGNVSNAEGEQLRSAFAAIDRTQDPEDIRQAINEAITRLQGSKERVRDAYNMTYEYKGKQPETKPVAAPAAAMPLTNSKGWKLHTDAAGNKAYVSPDGKQFEEAK
jgi:hypothetical protein